MVEKIIFIMEHPVQQSAICKWYEQIQTYFTRNRNVLKGHDNISSKSFTLASYENTSYLLATSDNRGSWLMTAKTTMKNCPLDLAQEDCKLKSRGLNVLWVETNSIETFSDW